MQKIINDKNFSYYAPLSAEEVLKSLGTTPEGLSDLEVAQRQLHYGYNEVRLHESGVFNLLIRQVKSPFIYLLLAVIVISLFVHSYFDAAVIGFIVIINTAVGFFQEYRAANALTLLQQFIMPVCQVMRGGQELEVNTRELVPGDIIVLYPGDTIPADFRIINAQNITVDESVLTGESEAVPKVSDSVTVSPTALYKAANIGFSGTTIMSGKVMGVVFATGSNTTMGDITALTVSTFRLSGFEKSITQFSSFILRLMLISLLVIFVANVLLKGGSVNIVQLIIFSCALAVSAIPEALPIITTFALAHGALRLARKKAVVKRLSAIEDLGNVEILCTDKTGTLTENVSRIEQIMQSSLPETLVYAALHNNELIKKMQQAKGFDLAIYQALSAQEKDALAAYKKIAEIPFDPARRSSLILVQHNEASLLLLRGSVEEVLNSCVHDATAANAINAWALEQGLKGRRVLLIAKKEMPEKLSSALSSSLDLRTYENNMIFVGGIAFGDPLKKTASAAIAKARLLGVEIKILSGDAKEVCGTIAQQIGLIQDASLVITGQDFAQMSNAEKFEVAKNYSVFARVSPHQKYEIISLLQKDKYVAYMGDGINDAPALKIANVALAVKGAAGIAQEAADIILLKKSLMVIIDGIEEGRIVFANTLKYIRTTLSATFGNFYSIALISLFIDYLPMLPVQLLLVNVLSDIPMLSIATDNVSIQELKRPAKYDTRSIIFLSTTLGFVSSLFDFIFFAFFYHLAPTLVQTGWFILNMLTEIVFVFSVRTTLPFFRATMPSFLLITLSTLVAALSVCLPFTALGQELFHFVAIPQSQLLAIIYLVIAYFATTDCIKVLYYKVYPVH